MAFEAIASANSANPAVGAQNVSQLVEFLQQQLNLPKMVAKARFEPCGGIPPGRPLQSLRHGTSSSPRGEPGACLCTSVTGLMNGSDRAR